MNKPPKCYSNSQPLELTSISYITKIKHAPYGFSGQLARSVHMKTAGAIVKISPDHQTNRATPVYNGERARKGTKRKLFSHDEALGRS